ncbi:MAG: hypothetical protein S4CHLAM7_05750 [Chlamydiae bacterium]|nr:hypothetical protein [Chlamydiota bacterium]
MTSSISNFTYSVYKDVNEAVQDAKENPAKTLGYTLLTVGAVAGSVAVANKVFESTMSTCSSYENYHFACDLVGFSRPEKLNPKTYFDHAVSILNLSATALFATTKVAVSTYLKVLTYAVPVLFIDGVLLEAFY